MNRKLCCIVLLMLFAYVIPNIAFAEMKTFIRDYTYQASEIDSKQSSRVIATEQVKRLLLEELGTYLESHTEVVNYELTKDEITTLTAGVVKTKILDEKWNGDTYWMKASIEADPDAVARDIQRLRHDKQKVKELEASKKKSDDTMKDMEVLREEIKSGKGGEEKVKQYNEKVQSMKMLQSMAQTFKSLQSGKKEDAIGTFINLMGTMIESAPSN